VGGKFQNPIWRPGGELIWDADITPEGVGLQLGGPLSSSFEAFFNGGFFILDENAKAADPLMYALQPGIKWNITNDTSLKVAAAYYAFSDVKGNPPLQYNAGSNTLDTAKNLKYNYNAPAFSGELGFKNPFGLTLIPYVGLFGEYMKNPDPSSDNQGYIGGLTFGDQSIKKLGDWNIEYTFRRLEKDAWLDVFPFSDFYGGATNVMGHTGKFSLGLTKNVSFGLTYINAWLVRGTPGGPANRLPRTQDLVQADLLFKF
jgi:hypothetical protein